MHLLSVTGWLEARLNTFYDRLSVEQPPCPADLIFVPAGLPERKHYGWALFQRGLAPVLLLSVGRNEARFLTVQVGLPDDGGIVNLLPIRPEDGNHLFLWAERGCTLPELVRLAELNTFGEIAMLSVIIRRQGLQHVLIVSSDVHLQRVRYAVHTLLGRTQVRITYVAVPPAESSVRRQRWWSRSWDAKLVLSEWLKLLGYWGKYGVLRWHQIRAGYRQHAAGQRFLARTINRIFPHPLMFLISDLERWSIRTSPVALEGSFDSIRYTLTHGSDMSTP